MTPAGGSAPRLTVRGGLYDGLSVALEGAGGERVLGSDPQCDLRLESSAVAAIHARFVEDVGEVRIVDANSPAGVFVNGERVSGSSVLSDGDRVSLGAPGSADAVTLIAHVPGRAATPAPHRPSAEDYTTEPPSIVPEGMGAGEGEELALPPPMPGRFVPPRPPKPPPDPKRLALIGGGAVAAAVVLFLIARSLLATVPSIHGVFPPRVEPGQTLTLHGTGFDAEGAPHVFIGDTEVTPQHSEPGELKVEVPAALAASAPTKVPVRVASGGHSSSAVYVETFLAPQITVLDPDVGVPGDEIVAQGKNLDGKGLDVTVSGVEAEVLEASATRLRFRVPELSWEPGRSAPVATRVETSRSQPVPLILGRLPLVTDVEPDRGVPGQLLTIHGRGFATPVEVTFEGQPGVLLSQSDREIRVLVPSGGGVGRTRALRVSVRVAGKPAMGDVRFTLARASANLYRPRFFPQPVPDVAPDQQIDVATELGPLLRLSGRAGTPSTQERAGRVAEALNALMTSDSRAQVELRKTNVGPAVGVEGRSFPVVTVTQADADGYARHPSVDALARFWTALIGDTLDLYLRGERPVRTAALTAHADVLVRLQADALRRSSGNGVPVALVSPPSRSLVDGLRELALDFPSAATPNPAIVAVGRWEGTLKEKDQPERSIRVDLRLAGRGLHGTLSRGSGKVVGELPLDEVRFGDGRLSFVLNTGGRAQQFSGPLEGLQIQGNVTEGRGGAVLGHFSLRFVD